MTNLTRKQKKQMDEEVQFISDTYVALMHRIQIQANNHVLAPGTNYVAYAIHEHMKAETVDAMKELLVGGSGLDLFELSEKTQEVVDGQINIAIMMAYELGVMIGQSPHEPVYFTGVCEHAPDHDHSADVGGDE